MLLPIRDETPDRSQQYIATGLAYGITRRLERLGSITIRSGAVSEWLPSSRRSVDANQQLGPTVLLRVTLARVADSLEVDTLLDSASGGERQVLVRRFADGDAREAESHLAAAVAGALFRAGVPFAPWPRDSATDPESFRLTTLGYHQTMPCAMRPPR